LLGVDMIITKRECFLNCVSFDRSDKV
jgi:hypothetical protein